MRKLALATIACALGVTACSHLREPTDGQLISLLRSPAADATDANALLDSKAVDCMRAWSGNDKLLRNLPVGAVSVEGKKVCHEKLDSALADSVRNPAKFDFAELTAPKVVTRAIELQEARRMAALANPAAHVPPAALTHKPVVSTPFVPQKSTVFLGAAGDRLDQAEMLCQKVQQAATQPKAGASIRSLAPFCVANLKRLRSAMQQSATNGQGDKRLDAIARSADSIAAAARNALANGTN